MSRAVCGGGGALEAIAAQSTCLNAGDGITGLLLSDGRRYLQAIEGEERNVRGCFARISNDPRHFDIRVVADEAIAQRQFGEWSMMVQIVGTANAAGFLDDARRCVETVTNPHLQALFIGFASLGRSRGIISIGQ